MDNNSAIQELLSDLSITDKLIYPDLKKISSRYLLINDKLEKIPLTIIEFLLTPILSIFSKIKIFSELLVPRHINDTDAKRICSIKGLLVNLEISTNSNKRIIKLNHVLGSKHSLTDIPIEKKISPEIFTDRWINKKKNDVKESAPARGLCFVNAVYEENVFKKINNNDFFPVFLIKGFS